MKESNFGGTKKLKVTEENQDLLKEKAGIRSQEAL